MLQFNYFNNHLHTYVISIMIYVIKLHYNIIFAYDLSYHSLSITIHLNLTRRIILYYVIIFITVYIIHYIITISIMS